MNRRFRLLPALLVVLLPIAVQAATENGVRAWVKTAPVTQRNLQETLTVYGEVRPDPEQVTGISAAHGGEVTRLWVGLGQVVEPGQQLLELTTDPAARRAYEQARAQVAYARKNLEQVKGLFGQQLATRAELAKAQQELANARSSLQAEVRLGANRAHQIIRAPQAAIVTRVNVAPGDRVQAGASLLTLGARAHLWVTLGIEPEDARRVRSGMNVDLTPVFDDAVHIKARIAQVHAVINPKTRLVDAVVKLQG
ncbi:MAG: efflux RND transporter periplasmic adaptor subunit, partial [Gammaproteobacteria bacterium]